MRFCELKFSFPNRQMPTALTQIEQGGGAGRYPHQPPPLSILAAPPDPGRARTGAVKSDREALVDNDGHREEARLAAAAGRSLVDIFVPISVLVHDEL